MEGVDAGYLYMETPTMHMHTLKIALVRPTQTFDVQHLAEAFSARLNQLEAFQRRAAPVPLRLHHPLWLTDRPVDLTRHVFEHAMPDPGGMAGLEALIGTIAGTPLDRSIPLWEMHVCAGLGDGRVAIVTKMHHALADGVAANALLGSLTDGAVDQQAPGPLVLEPTPSRRRQVGLALLDAIRQIGIVPGLLRRTLAAAAAVVRHRRGSEIDVPRPLLDVPRVSFNGALTSERLFATHTLPLADLKEVKERHGVTLNDVVLAVVSGALRRWMAERGEHPAASLVAGVPVSTDDPGAPPRLRGNRVSNLFTSLATDVEDPHERLQVISLVTSEAKALHRTLGPTMLVDWVQFTPPAPFSGLMNLYSRSRAASLHPAPFNVIVSNVPGPREPVTISGAGLDDLFSVGPILEGIGLNVTAWSYVDRLNFSMLSCPALIPDLGPLVAQLRPALDELRKVTTTEGDD